MGRWNHRFFGPALDLTDWLEPKLRKAVGLNPKAPQAVPMSFGPPDERGLVELLDISKEETQAEYRAWHQEPVRAQVISRGMDTIKDVARALDKLEDFPRDLKSRIYNTRTQRKLKEARILTWEPYHYWPYGEPVQIDGRLVFSKEPYDTISLDISCLGMEEYWFKEEAASGEVYIKEPKTRQVETIVLPTKVLSPELVELGLKLWYMRRFEFKQGHWAILERTLPAFKIVEARETADDLELEEKRLKSINSAHKEMNRLLKKASQNPYSNPTWSEFGQSLGTLRLPVN